MMYKEVKVFEDPDFRVLLNDRVGIDHLPKVVHPLFDKMYENLGYHTRQMVDAILAEKAKYACVYHKNDLLCSGGIITLSGDRVGVPWWTFTKDIDEKKKELVTVISHSQDLMSLFEKDWDVLVSWVWNDHLIGRKIAEKCGFTFSKHTGKRGKMKTTDCWKVVDDTQHWEVVKAEYTGV